MTPPAGNIYLIGFSYTGKSTVGRLLANRLGMAFVDTDADIAAHAGKPVSDIFESGGESAFRAMESAALAAAVAGPDAVVATGGGIVEDPANRYRMVSTGAIICLNAQPETILQRMRDDATTDGQPETRPLLSGDDPLRRITELKRRRERLYTVADLTVNTDHLSAPQVVVAVEAGVDAARTRLQHTALMASITEPEGPNAPVQVETDTASYPVVVGAGVLSDLGQHVASLTAGGQNLDATGRAFVITDTGIPQALRDRARDSLDGAGWQSEWMTIPAGETSKTLAQADAIYAWLAGHRAERRHPIIALGGGVVGDLTGFVAATYLRGVPFIQAPTTLLAMVDAAIGGKVAIDLPHGKNLVGVFYQPRLVLADTTALVTLPSPDFTAGWAEVIKTGVISGGGLFEFLEEHAAALVERDDDRMARAVRWCAAIKSRVVSEDEREITGLRALLNYGHTLGHALESTLEYTGLRHGEAVAIGMSFAAILAETVGALAPEDRARQNRLLATFGLPTEPPPAVDVTAVLTAMAVDKKVADGQTRWVLPDALGQARLRAGIPQAVADTALRAFLAGP